MTRIERFVLAGSFFGAIVAVNPLGLDPYTLPKLAFFAAGLAMFGAMRVIRGADLPVPQLALPALAVFASAALSALFSPDRAGAWLGSSELHAYALAPMLLYLGAMFATSDGEADEKIGWALALGCAALGLSALSQRFTGSVFPGLAASTVAGNRVTALMGSPVYLGAVCAVCAPFVFERAAAARSASRPVAIACFVLLLAGLALCGSRGAWAAFAAASAVFAFLRASRWRRYALRIVAAGAVLVVIGKWSAAGRSTGASDRARRALWTTSARMGLANPLLGVGPGAFENSIARFVDDEWVAAHGRVHTQAHAHNGPLNAFATTGLVGAAAWCWLLFALGSRLRPAFEGVESRDRGVATAAASLAAVCVQSAFNPMPPVVWAVAAWSCARAAGGPRRFFPRPAGVVFCVAALVCAGSIFRAVAADRAFRAAREAAHAGDARTAIDRYAQVSRLAPWNASARREMVRVLLAVSQNSSDPQQARSLARRAVDEARGAVADRPASWMGFQALGTALWRARDLGDKIENTEIRDAFSQAWERDPVRAGVMESLFKFESSLGDRSAAERWRRRLSELAAVAASRNPKSD